MPSIKQYIPKNLIRYAWHLPKAILANLIFLFPSKKLTTIGITGTDGKSSTALFSHQILQQLGHKAVVISTVTTKMGEQTVSQAGLHITTPSPVVIQKLLAQAVKNNCQYAIIEVTSLAIDQFRVWGIDFDLAALTNIDLDHTDYHGSFESYAQTKLSWLKKAKQIVSPLTYKKNFKNQDVLTYGFDQQADLSAQDLQVNNKISKFNLKFKNQTVATQTSIPGKYNILNISAAVLMALLLDHNLKQVGKIIPHLKLPKGRFHVVNDKPLTIVDYAHTPQGLEAILSTLKDLYPQKKLIHIFGATGDRDKDKRKIMGKISSKYADMIILTSEDTYSEDPLQIIKMIEAGIPKKNQSYFKIPDRKKAIQKAIAQASPNDILLMTGVGHQTTLNVGGQEIDWDEVEVVKKLLHI